MLNFLALPDHPYTRYYCVRLAWFWARTVEHWANLMSIMETKCKVEFLVFHKTTKGRVRTENIKQYASKSYGGRWGVDIHVNCFTMYVMSARSSIDGITMGWHKEWLWYLRRDEFVVSDQSITCMFSTHTKVLEQKHKFATEGAQCRARFRGGEIFSPKHVRFVTFLNRAHNACDIDMLKRLV